MVCSMVMSKAFLDDGTSDLLTLKPLFFNRSSAPGCVFSRFNIFNKYNAEYHAQFG